MNSKVIGWTFVAIQAVLIVALVVLPSRDDWPTPSVVNVVGTALLLAGFVIMAVAALSLGRSLTPTPVPVAHGELTTSGLYQFVRHPIYTAVLAIVVSLTIRSGSWISLGVAAVTVIFFNSKARWEEDRLSEAYPDYDAYAARTPRFIPQPWRT